MRTGLVVEAFENMRTWGRMHEWAGRGRVSERNNGLRLPGAHPDFKLSFESPRVGGVPRRFRMSVFMVGLGGFGVMSCGNSEPPFE